jgi:hypothetical protein
MDPSRTLDRRLLPVLGHGGSSTTRREPLAPAMRDNVFTGDTGTVVDPNPPAANAH